MSYGIVVRQEFNAKCSQCDFSETCSSAGQAEQAAREHIDDDYDGEALNYHHEVKILQMTVVGRD